MNSIPKVVFSRALSEAPWGLARLVREDVSEEVAKMKAHAVNDLVLFAGADLASTFMNLDLVDEYRQADQADTCGSRGAGCAQHVAFVGGCCFG